MRCCRCLPAPGRCVAAGRQWAAEGRGTPGIAEGEGSGTRSVMVDAGGEMLRGLWIVMCALIPCRWEGSIT